jgi:hypothetical protein
VEVDDGRFVSWVQRGTNEGFGVGGRRYLLLRISTLLRMKAIPMLAFLADNPCQKSLPTIFVRQGISTLPEDFDGRAAS